VGSLESWERQLELGEILLESSIAKIELRSDSDCCKPLQCVCCRCCCFSVWKCFDDVNDSVVS
jgi:hypothetical protein